MTELTRILCASLTFATFLVSSLGLHQTVQAAKLRVEWDGHSQVVEAGSLSDTQLLAQLGVSLAPEDSCQRQKPGEDGLPLLRVRRAVNFSIVQDGQSKQYRSSKVTVGEALKEKGFFYRRSRLYPRPGTPLQEGLVIHLLGKDERLVEHEAETEPEKEYIPDQGLAAGVEVVEKQGTPGRAKIYSAAHRQKKDQRRELGRRQLQRGEKTIIRQGLARSVKTPEGYKRYKKKLVCEATAYVSTGHRTSLGLWPYEGIVAVDPDFIPYYTKMYIPGYGMAMAGDTGGDMNHHRIDLFMNSYQRAIQFGRRTVEVYILED